MGTLLRTELRGLHKSLCEVGLPAIGLVWKRVFENRTPEKHAEWDESTRQKPQDRVVEPLASGIHTPPQEGVEVPPSELRNLDELPPIDCGVAPDCEEIEALQVCGGIRRDGRRVLVSDPQSLLSAFTRLVADTAVWNDYGQQIGRIHLYQDVVAPVQRLLRRAVDSDVLTRLCCQLSRLYGVRVRKVDAKEIYSTAGAFVSRAGNKDALTISTSSGIIDPLERSGTADVIRSLGLSDDSLAAKLRKKDAWRVQNFRNGLLNPVYEARRPYYFNRSVTADAMRATIAALPERSRNAYGNLAAQHLAEAVECPGFELYEVAEFCPWMWRYTRSAPGHVLISFRHPETRAIAHGLELNFTNPAKLHAFYTCVFTGAGLATRGSSFFAKEVMIAGALEGMAYSCVEHRVLRAKAEEEARQHAARVQIEGATRAQRVANAREYICGLLGY